jgi:hypothetical protein
MKSADDAAKDDTARAVMRTYADDLQPPPVADIIARAEHTPDAPHPPSTDRPRGRLVIAAALVTAVAIAATVAVLAIATNRQPDRGPVAATRPTPSSGPFAAPGCPPGLPLLEGPFAAGGSKPVSVEPGQQLTLRSRTLDWGQDRPLLTYAVYLLPAGPYMTEPANAVAQSPVLRLTPHQQHVSPVLRIPRGLAPGTYNLYGYATWPGPSVCGVKNPPHSTSIGMSWGGVGSVVIK